MTRGGTTSSAVSASWATAGGTATSGSDFTANSGTVSFAANETSKTITVATIDDAAVESVETMTVTLSSPSAGATIATATGTGTINDNDGGSSGLTMSASNASVTEGGNLSFQVTLSSSSPIALTYSTANGTATAPQDYSIVSGSLNLSAGSHSLTITVATVNDTTIETAETMNFNWSATSGPDSANATAVGTINDND